MCNMDIVYATYLLSFVCRSRIALIDCKACEKLYNDFVTQSMYVK
jgi:hypothetical protein